jgi:peptidoglycan/LPS O-acetylase OafA/YrhL
MLSDAAWLRWLANPMFLEFAAGVALARLRRPIAALGARLGVLLILAGAAAFAVEFGIGVGEIIGDPWLVLNGGGLWPRLLLYGVPAAVIVAGAVAVEPWAHGRLAAVLAIGGDASYAIYLTHPLAMQQLGLVWRTLHGPRWPLALVAAGAVSSLVGGLLTWWVIERPILRDLKRLSLAWPPWRAAAVATPT